ncbi:MAG: fibrobacter succinogenes major paralogous domain-containing protein [Bacteroidia bacterium]|nr:fibrobacter succinogenes major paralogous domain-containing protein [Bacteroidia bacterium]
MKNKSLLMTVAILIIAMSSVAQKTDTFTDKRDGKTYKTVKIGTQTWMAENLKTTYYRDGSEIPNITDKDSWSNLTTGAYCSYDNSTGNANTYGTLYNWYAINDNRELCPSGWHLPTDAEWKTLEMALGMSHTNADKTSWRGTDEGGKLKETGTTHWNSPNTGATNTNGFTALPGGYREYDGTFKNIGSYGLWWSATETNTTTVWDRALSYENTNMYRYNSSYKVAGFSVRCLKD